MRQPREVYGRRASAAVEMAVILPLLLTIVFGIIEVSRLGMAAQLLTNAAREGCRVAVLPHSTAADVRSRVDAVLHGSGITVETVDITVGPVVPMPSSWLAATKGTPITVGFSVPFAGISWLPMDSIFKDATITTSATLSSERL